MLRISRKLFKDPCILNLIRKCTNASHRNTVRVRFAPSPTGFLHLGGLRTALYNYLFSKAKNGKFILRIEDTDQTRFVKGSVEKIIEDLNWAGIEIDEGPHKIGGQYGPYVQSERLEIYRNEVRKLLENGTAYYCFCTERRLELLRKEALRQRQIPKYDNKCRHLTPTQIAEKLTNSDKFCIRFKLSKYTEPFNDLIHGNITHDVAENEGDPIIIKSDGYPTYHLANVIDDHLMDITHVFRGIEWQISTTKHLLMYKAFNWKPPKYGHLPLLINTDGTKLSKRQGDIQINQYKENGIYPLALINYITQAGGGFTKNQDKLKLYSIQELIPMFDISKINLNPGRLNPDLLSEFNRLEIKRRLNDEIESENLINELKSLIEKKFPHNKEKLDLNNENIKNILQWSLKRITNLNDLIDGDLRFLWILPKKQIDINLNYDIILELCLKLENITNFQKDNIILLLKTFSKENNIKFSNFMKLLRTALSGLNDGPSVAEMMEILGKDISIKRLKNLKNC